MNNAYAAGQKLLCGKYEMFTPYGKSHFVKNGVYTKTPAKGRIVYFYSESKKRVAHVGIVVNCTTNVNGTITMETVEGNTSVTAFDRNGGCVARKSYTFTTAEVGETNRINGFGIPKFGNDTCTLNEFVKTALSEVGYEEKASNKNLNDPRANPGTNNFTKYGEWYGTNGVYWCQQYVSWVAYTACKLHMENTSNGWTQDEKGWRYRRNGNFIRSQWLETGGRWYVFDAAGYAIVGWFRQDDGWYYLNPKDCAMLSSQWIELDNKWYYLSDTGLLATNAYVKSKAGIYMSVDKDGVYDMLKDTTTIPRDIDEIVEEV